MSLKKTIKNKGGIKISRRKRLKEDFYKAGRRWYRPKAEKGEDSNSNRQNN